MGGEQEARKNTKREPAPRPRGVKVIDVPQMRGRPAFEGERGGKKRL